MILNQGSCHKHLFSPRNASPVKDPTHGQQINQGIRDTLTDSPTSPTMSNLPKNKRKSVTLSKTATLLDERKWFTFYRTKKTYNYNSLLYSVFLPNDTVTTTVVDSPDHVPHEEEEGISGRCTKVFAINRHLEAKHSLHFQYFQIMYFYLNWWAKYREIDQNKDTKHAP